MTDKQLKRAKEIKVEIVKAELFLESVDTLETLEIESAEDICTVNIREAKAKGEPLTPTEKKIMEGVLAATVGVRKQLALLKEEFKKL